MLSWLCLQRNRSMKLYLNGLLLLLITLLVACQEEEVIPVVKSASVEIDSTAASTTGDDTTSNEQPPGVLGADTAYYRDAALNGMPYRIMYPRKYDRTKSYPLVVFLHGIGERGNDNQKQLQWGASLFKSDSVSKEYPAFVIFPQCPADAYWTAPQSMQRVMAIIDYVNDTEHIDDNRIYLAGLSMGAFGTYAMIAAYPNTFAAAVAISGDGDVSKASVMSKTKWSIFGGKKDMVVTSDRSQKMADALSRAGADVRIKIYESADHVGSWVNAFKEPDFCAWLFSIRKD